MLTTLLIIFVILLCAYLADSKVVPMITDTVPNRIVRALVWIIAIILILACVGLVSPGAVNL